MLAIEPVVMGVNKYEIFPYNKVLFTWNDKTVQMAGAPEGEPGDDQELFLYIARFAIL